MEGTRGANDDIGGMQEVCQVEITVMEVRHKVALPPPWSSLDKIKVRLKETFFPDEIKAFSSSRNQRRNLLLLLSMGCHLSLFSSFSLLRSPLIWRVQPSSTSTSTSTSSFFTSGRSAAPANGGGGAEELDSACSAIGSTASSSGSGGRAHECSVCHRTFSIGQALGGP